MCEYLKTKVGEGICDKEIYIRVGIGPVKLTYRLVYFHRKSFNNLLSYVTVLLPVPYLSVECPSKKYNIK